MKFDPDIYHRRSIRLKEYDYSSPGGYFVTICTKNRECLFGDIKEGIIKLTSFGEIVERLWFEIPDHFENIFLDHFVIMPNHIHGIIMICDVRDEHIIGNQYVAGVQYIEPLRYCRNNDEKIHYLNNCMGEVTSPLRQDGCYV